MRRQAQSGGAAGWRRRLGRFERAGLTVAEFCDREGVSSSSFYQWRRKLAQQTQATRRAPAARASAGQTCAGQTCAGQTCAGRACAGRAGAGRAGAAPTPAFQAVLVRPALPPLVVELPGGARIEVPAENLELVRAVIGELAAVRDDSSEGGAAC